MAYMNFSEIEAPAPAAAEERSSASTGFSGLEWSVVALAERDRLTSLREPGRVARALASLFGTGQSIRLADDRLEALRRIAVLAWHKSYTLPVSELRAFLSAGFSMDQYETLLRSISHARANGGRQGA